MKLLLNFTLTTFWLLPIIPALAQQNLRIIFYDSGIDHSPADPCKFKFSVSTHAMGQGPTTATANGWFSVSGSAGSVSGSLYAEDSGQGIAIAKDQATYSFPGFGKLDGNGEGIHNASDSNSSLSNPSASFITMECELFAHNPPNPCEHLPAKQLNNDPCNVSPIVLDLDKNGFTFGGASTAIYYDIYGSGTPTFMHWVVANENDAFLIYDVNRNGLADDGSELFGNGSRMILQDNRLAPNGFVALGQHDTIELGGNNDGFIDHRDEVWSQLALWLDLDADGISTYNEMIPLNEFGLNGFEIIPRDHHQFDEWGNWLPYWANASTTDGPIDMVDVFFRIVQPIEPKQLAD